MVVGAVHSEHLHWKTWGLNEPLSATLGHAGLCCEEGDGPQKKGLGLITEPVQSKQT